MWKLKHPATIRHWIWKSQVAIGATIWRPPWIFAANTKKIRASLLLKPGDSSTYQKFFNLLIKCENIMSQQQWNSLNSPNILCTLTPKLPKNTRDKRIRKSCLSDDAESKVQSWQILLTASMMRLCWQVTHFFLEKHRKCMKRNRKRIIWRKRWSHVLQTPQTRSKKKKLM